MRKTRLSIRTIKGLSLDRSALVEILTEIFRAEKKGEVETDLAFSMISAGEKSERYSLV